MRAFAEAWPKAEFVQQAAAQLPWFHLCTLLDKLGTREEREWYLAKAVEHGWSRSVLVMQIETQLRERAGRATTNFDARIPKPQSDLARETLKEPYRFDFLGLSNEAQEREVENALMSHISRFLLELGAGFAFVGRQVHVEVGGEDFFLDLLFYHLRLRCFVVKAEGASIDEDAIKAYVKENLARYKVPGEVLVLDAMPTNASGKILKRELRAFESAR